MKNTLYPTPDAAFRYYAYKFPTYESKYGNGPFTHIHSGLYDSASHAYLFRRDFDLSALGVDAIRHLMTSGQEALVAHLVTTAHERLHAHGQDMTILDCGAGHGGATFTLALLYGAHVHAVVLSPDQAAHIEAFAERLGIQDRISVEVRDLRESMPRSSFDIIVMIDALCQVGRWARTVESLRALLAPNGRLFISDYYVPSVDELFALRFNDYWKSAVTDMDTVFDFLRENHSCLKSFRDLTAEQMPFWRLSVAHSSLRMGSEQTGSPEHARLCDSMAFHEDMITAFDDGRLRYVQLALGAPR